MESKRGMRDFTRALKSCVFRPGFGAVASRGGVALSVANPRPAPGVTRRADGNRNPDLAHCQAAGYRVCRGWYRFLGEVDLRKEEGSPVFATSGLGSAKTRRFPSCRIWVGCPVNWESLRVLRSFVTHPKASTRPRPCWRLPDCLQVRNFPGIRSDLRGAAG